MNHRKIHQQLLDPATYPEPTRTVDFRETHISQVYLTDSRAYKFKKPLNLGFLDYSTLERRGFFCAEEVRLNRRFAPEVYLGVVELRADRGALNFNGPGELVDFAVCMRRLPEERMLDRMLDVGDPDLPRELQRLGRHLAPLLETSAICREDNAGSHAAAVRANCEENLAQTESAIGRALTIPAHRIMTKLTGSQLDRLTPLMIEREARGFVRDGHGDLHARNICMTDPIQVYDCIEFCRRFRVADIAAELAFLLMDLEFRGRRDLAREFLASYQAHAASPDFAGLLPFYKSYRAWVRGKVDALLAGETDVEPMMRRQALERSRRYFNLALGYHAPQALLLTAGLMGVGKTTLARGLAIAIGGELLRSDEIRKELAGISPCHPCPEAFAQGLYSPEMTRKTYAELRQRASRLLHAGQIVIIDASFARSAERQAFFELADMLGKPAWLLYLHCDRETALSRLDRRQAEGTDASDGRRELVETQAAAFEPPDCLDHLITIDSSAAVDYNVQIIICLLLAGG